MAEFWVLIGFFSKDIIRPCCLWPGSSSWFLSFIFYNTECQIQTKRQELDALPGVKAHTV